MNYKIITDEKKLRDFIEWLPELNKDECYYISLLARSKYCDSTLSISSDKQQLKRFTTTKDFMFEKIKQLECEIGSYFQKHNPIPQEALAIYITLNPRSYIKAAREGINKLTDLMLKPYNGFNPHQEIMSEIQKARGRKIYHDLDFDDSEISDIKKLTEGKINQDCLYWLKTRGGFHLLIKMRDISKEYVKTWHGQIHSIPGIDTQSDGNNKGDNMIPIVGCTQGGYTPHFE